MTTIPLSCARPLALTLSLLALASGCGDETDDPTEAEAKSATTAVDGTTEAAEVSGWFGDTSDLEAEATLTVAEARPIATASAASALSGAVTLPACLALDTDDATYVEATFTSCSGPGGRARLTGSVRGELGVVTTPCGPAQCPTSVQWTLTADLTWSDGRSLAGDWTLTAPIVASAPRELEGQLTIARDDQVTVTSETSASWVTDGAGCTTLDAESMLLGASPATLSVEGVEVCPGACPTAGLVAYTGARGIISWSYDGGAVVTVVNGDRTFPLSLRCGP